MPKKVLIITASVIAGLVVIFLAVALFINEDYAAEREIVINKEKSMVFDYIKYLKNQDNYGVWANIDPEMKKNCTGTDGTVGFISAWESENPDVGEGEQEITNILVNERVDFELRFKVPYEASAKAYMITEAVSSNTTKVKWGISGTMKYPFNLLIPLMNFDELMNTDLNKGLENLKNVLEK